MSRYAFLMSIHEHGLQACMLSLSSVSVEEHILS